MGRESSDGGSCSGEDRSTSTAVRWLATAVVTTASAVRPDPTLARS